MIALAGEGKAPMRGSGVHGCGMWVGGGGCGVGGRKRWLGDGGCGWRRGCGLRSTCHRTGTGAGNDGFSLMFGGCRRDGGSGGGFGRTTTSGGWKRSEEGGDPRCRDGGGIPTLRMAGGGTLVGWRLTVGGCKRAGSGTGEDLIGDGTGGMTTRGAGEGGEGFEGHG